MVSLAYHELVCKEVTSSRVSNDLRQTFPLDFQIYPSPSSSSPFVTIGPCLKNQSEKFAAWLDQQCASR